MPNIGPMEIAVVLIIALLILGPKRLGYAAGISCHGTQMLDFARELDGVHQPVCVVWGDQDRVLHVSSADLFRKGIKNSEVMIIPGSGHMPLVENAGACSKAWLAFAQKAQRSMGTAA